MTNERWHDDACPRCFIGRLDVKRAAFISVHQQQLVVLPNAIAYICDICGYQEFDDSAVKALSDWLLDNQVSDPLPLKRKPRGKAHKSQS